MVPLPSDKVPRVSSYSGYRLLLSPFAYGAFTLSGRLSQNRSARISLNYAVHTPVCTHTGLGSSHFARRYFGNRCFLLFLSLLRCFSSGGSPPYVMYWRMDTTKVVGFPIQKSPDQWIFAPPRSFSQLITSFIGSQCQGIHPALFFV